ncbi:MAG: hypothetical protein QMD46_01555 [Methanomicrobiales archaeon]|nr:hypothetical protein [Methanomicrobiales archaeon]MDI6875783.1 hypothetical protein [Methanomicrobiales archaeon]
MPDRIAAVIVAVFIVHPGWWISKDSTRTCLDAPVRSDIRSMRCIIPPDPTVSRIKTATGRSPGRSISVEATVGMAEQDPAKAYRESERIEDPSVPNVGRILVP